MSNVHLFHLLSSTFASLCDIWTQIGISEPQQRDELQSLYESIATLCNTAVAKSKEDLQAHQDEVNGLYDQTNLAAKKLGDVGNSVPEWCVNLQVPNGTISSLRQTMSVLDEISYRMNDLLKERVSVRNDLWSQLLKPSQHQQEYPCSVQTLLDIGDEIMKQREAVKEHDRVTKETLLAQIKDLWEQLRVGDKERENILLKVNLIEQGKSRTLQAQVPKRKEYPGWVPNSIVSILHAEPTPVQRAIQELRHQLKTLTAEMKGRIAQQVTECSSLLTSLCKELALITGEEMSTASYNVGASTVEEANTVTLSLLEGEIVGVEQKLYLAREANTLYSRYEELQAMRADVELNSKDRRELLTSKKVNMAQQLLLEERTRKTLKKELPRIMQRLSQLGQEYLELTEGQVPLRLRKQAQPHQFVDVLDDVVAVLANDPYCVVSTLDVVGGSRGSSTPTALFKDPVPLSSRVPSSSSFGHIAQGMNVPPTTTSFVGPTSSLPPTVRRANSRSAKTK